MGPLELCILFLAAAAQGFLGFGFGIVAMGGLSLLQELHHSAALVNVTGLVTTAGLAPCCWPAGSGEWANPAWW